MKNLQFKLLNLENLNAMANLAAMLNPDFSFAEVKDSFTQMLGYDNYRCLGLLQYLQQDSIRNTLR